MKISSLIHYKKNILLFLSQSKKNKMAEYKLLLPSMGEGVMEATIVSWLYKEGDFINEDDSVVEIATDKVDSDVPTPVSGKLLKILKQKDEIAQVGEVIAILETKTSNQQNAINETLENHFEVITPSEEIKKAISIIEEPLQNSIQTNSTNDVYLSPLVKSIIQEENISEQELKTIEGTGQAGRITKEDVLLFLENKKEKTTENQETNKDHHSVENKTEKRAIFSEEGDEIIQMDRVRKIISESMVKSKFTAPHVTSFIETDVTNIVKWRAKNKNTLLKRDGEKLTFMPIFIHAIVKSIQDYRMINVSVDGDKIIKKKNINIGIATALPDGNLIVPVIKNADQLSLSGLAKAINNLVHRARNKKLKPEDTQGATYTISNIGTFGNLMGTPIIPMPQVAILVVGAIVKKPAVVETPEGDMIAIRHKMFMSHSYDHRVVDGSLGGMFLKSVNDYLENWDLETEI